MIYVTESENLFTNKQVLKFYLSSRETVNRFISWFSSLDFDVYICLFDISAMCVTFKGYSIEQGVIIHFSYGSDILGVACLDMLEICCFAQKVQTELKNKKLHGEEKTYA